MISIDEQIAYKKHVIKLLQSIESPRDVANEEAILASLERLKAIDAVQVPDEPESVRYLRECVVARTRGESALQYIDTLRDLLKRESARADRLSQMRLDDEELTRKYHAEKRAAERQLAAILKLGAEPSEEMIAVGGEDLPCPSDAIHVFRAMFAKLVEESGVKK